MSTKVFTSTTLSASDINTYLNNGGLVYITSATVAGTPSSLTVPSCFSSEYDHYRVVFNGITFSASGYSYTVQVGGYSSGYYGSEAYDVYNGTNGVTRTVAGAGLYFGVQDTGRIGGILDVSYPYIVAPTFFMGMSYGANYGGWTTGQHNTSASCTSFTISCGSGTLTGGTINVYGYRKP